MNRQTAFILGFAVLAMVPVTWAMLLYTGGRIAQANALRELGWRSRPGDFLTGPIMVPPPSTSAPDLDYLAVRVAVMRRWGYPGSGWHRTGRTRDCIELGSRPPRPGEFVMIGSKPVLRWCWP